MYIYVVVGHGHVFPTTCSNHFPFSTGLRVSISMDFIIDLPPIHGYEVVLVMVDRFTKMAHFAPCAKTISAEETTDVFLSMWCDFMGVRNNITSDHIPQFVSLFCDGSFRHLAQQSICPHPIILKPMAKLSGLTKF